MEKKGRRAGKIKYCINEKKNRRRSKEKKWWIRFRIIKIRINAALSLIIVNLSWITYSKIVK